MWRRVIWQIGKHITLLGVTPEDSDLRSQRYENVRLYMDVTEVKLFFRTPRYVIYDY